MSKNEKSTPRVYTTEEIRHFFLSHVEDLVDFFEKESRREGVREKLEGLAFSIMSALDGSSAALPGFIVAPNPHPSDKQYSIDKGMNYYPENSPEVIYGDIAGCLHEQIFHPREGNRKSDFAQDLADMKF
jgi:hypothetical protein